MSKICWARVDDRLIHGQVTVAWRQHLRYDGICVVDAETRADPFLRDALRLATPPGIAVNVYTVQEAIAAFAPRVARSRPSAPPRKTLLLVKSPQTALALIEAGLPLPQLNVGNVSARPGSVRVFRTVSLTPEHAAALDALAGHGVRVTFQLTPDDPQVDWRAVRQRM